LMAALVAFVRRRLGWSLPIQPVSPGTYLVLLLYNIANLLLLGAAAAFVITELNGPLTAVQVAAVIVVTAVSWAVGYAAFFVPAGLGVRETVMLALLANVGVAGSVVLVPLVTRAVVLASEMLFGGVGLLMLWRLAARRR